MSDLDDILSGGEVAEVAEPEQTTEEVVEAQPTGEPEPEKEEVKAEDSTPEPKKSEESNWQFEAYKDEKSKRQALGQENQDLKRQLEELKNPKKPPDVFEDQEGFVNDINSKISQSEIKMKAEMSKFMADREYGSDVVQQKLEQFREMVSKDPSLSQKVAQSPSPVHEAIDIVDKAAMLSEVGNVKDFKEKVRAEMETEIRAQIEAEIAEKTKSSVTPSLNSMASSSGDKIPDDSLSAILDGR